MAIEVIEIWWRCKNYPICCNKKHKTKEEAERCELYLQKNASWTLNIKDDKDRPEAYLADERKDLKLSGFCSSAEQGYKK